MTVPSEILGRLWKLPKPLSRDVVVERGLQVPADDGTTLLADRYAIRDSAPGPTVLVRSPYGRDGFVGLVFGRLFAERGLQTVVQSTRGTQGSGGDFNPFDERADGLATLRWLRAQPWHAGRIGMTGPSYLGLTQWSIADELDVLTPTVTATQFHGQSFAGGSLSLQTALAWMAVVGVEGGRLTAPYRMVRALRALPPLYDALPLNGLDELAVGRKLPFYAEWMANTTPDTDYWTTRDFTAISSRVDAPVQLIGGWHDIFTPWQLADHAALTAAGKDVQLIVGPWTHAAPELAARAAQENLRFLRAGLLDAPRSGAPVRVFVQRDGWRDFASWPPPGATERTLHLGGDGSLGPEPPADSTPRRFVYDPEQPTPSLGGPTIFERVPIRDNAELEARDDVLVYTSEPLADDTVAAGPVRATVTVTSELEHYDVFVRLCDVDAAGVSRNVCDGLLRCVGDQTVAVDLWPTAYRFAAGHRLRVQVSGGAHPRYARNPGTGDPLVEATELRAGAREIHGGTLQLTVLP